MFRSKFFVLLNSRWQNSSFNPCSRGCSARRLYQADPLSMYWFQSLFSWMFRSKIPAEYVCCSKYRFQSLFSWMFRSKHTRTSERRYRVAVSILVLVDVPLEDGTIHSKRLRTGFQSLFSWMFRSKAVCFCDREGRVSFNPCSRGCSARSVLRSAGCPGPFCFNPCSRGCSARRR